MIAFNCLKTAALILYFCAFLVKELYGADSNFRRAVSGPIHLSTKQGTLLQKGKSLDYFTVVNDHKLELIVIDYIIQINYIATILAFLLLKLFFLILTVLGSQIIAFGQHPSRG